MREIMRLWAIIGAAFLLVLFLGCASAPPDPEPEWEPEPDIELVEEEQIEEFLPLTAAIFERLEEYYQTLMGNTHKFQLVLSGNIILERETYEKRDEIQQGGKVIFKDHHTRQIITIEDRTEGVAIGMEYHDTTVILSVCFENDNRYLLFFDCFTEEPDAMFYLDYHANETRGGLFANNSMGDRGSVVYGGEVYRLRYGDEKPHLLINLSEVNDRTINAHRAPGRRAE